jgi:hypothetical protein
MTMTASSYRMEGVDEDTIRTVDTVEIGFPLG